MPTIKQLPAAVSVAATDLLPLSQGGSTRALAVGSLLSSVQPAIALATGKLLGRVSVTAGGPEAVGLGVGLTIAAGSISATGIDHTQLPIATSIQAGDEVVVNSGGAAKRMPTAVLRGLFAAGPGVTIDTSGIISAGGSASIATTASPGLVQVGSGLKVTALGTVTPDGSIVALRSALATVALSGTYGDLAGLPVLGNAAARGIGVVTGTVAAGDDSRLTGAVQVSALGSVTVTATGATLARSLADHAADALTLADFGVSQALPATDQSAGFQNAQNAFQGVGGGILRVKPGSYMLGSNIYTAGMNTWLFERGATLTGPGQIDAVTDAQALGASGQTLARLLAATFDEHGYHVSIRLAPTNSGTGYEKAAVYARVISNDPSSYDGQGDLLTIRDGTAFEGQASIAAGTMTGRVWGINTGAGPDAGGDGYAVGGEFGVQSYSGSDAGPLGTATSKIGVHAVAYGNSTATAAFVVSGNGTTFQDGHVVQFGSVSVGGMRFPFVLWAAPAPAILPISPWTVRRCSPAPTWLQRRQALIRP